MNYRKWSNKYSTDCKLKYNSKSTQENYISCVNRFLIDFNRYREPKEVPTKEIKEWLLKAKTINTRKHKLCAIKSFYVITVGMPNKINSIPYPKAEKTLPQVIDKDHILKSISKISNLKHKAIITLAFSTGMRVSEVCNLKISDIDSKRMIITIRQGKGRKDRIAPLSQTNLNTMREYFKVFRPIEYLFNGQSGLKYSHTSCNKIVKKYLGSEYHFHQLRHSNATALLESGTDIRIIQKLLGHSSSKTTEIYTHVSTQLISKVKAPI